MQQVIIIGAGGHSAEIDDYVQLNKDVLNPSIQIIGFLDDNPLNYDNYKFSAPLLGSISEHVISKDISIQYIMGIANLQYRRPIIERFIEAGASFTTFIHPSATISPSAKIGKGVVIAPNVNIGPNVIVDDYTLINSRCSIGHDTYLGKFNFISPNVCFSGFSKVGEENLFGINSATIPGISIGNRNKIMAGMVLDKPVGDNEVVFFRFKEKVLAFSK
jgi:sugar O-acyltransferase (sialic acid O-acetyltransferase NeuD family)